MMDERSGSLVVRSPSTGDVVADVPVCDAAAVREAVAQARLAQVAWGRCTVLQRAARVAALGEALVTHADDLIDALSLETGLPRFESLVHEVLPTVNRCHHLAQHAETLLADQPIALHLHKHRASYLHYVPMGVVGVIAPSSHPLAIPMSAVIAALLAGNAVVVKPSERTPLAVRKAVDLAVASGLPAGLFQVVTGGAQTGAALIDAGVQRVVFTGSVATGRRVGAACGERLIPCALALAGNAPLIACADCDIERTARAIVYGGFTHAGASCVSVERVYAHAAVYDALVTRVVALTAELRVGDGERADVDVGAMIAPGQRAAVEALVADAVARGATVAAGGRTMDGPGCYHEPTVLVGCDPTMTVLRQEIAGPVIAMTRVASDEEAVRLANDSDLGLYAYVFSRNDHGARALAERVEAGTVMINDVVTAFTSVEAPSVGIKQSGHGTVHGDDALRAMSHARHVNHERFAMPARDPLWFPYGPVRYRALKATMGLLFGRHGFMGRLRDLF